MAHTIDLSELQEIDYLEEHAKKLVSPSAISDKVLERFSNADRGTEGTTTPWSKVEHLWRFRHSEVTVWAGINKHRKSMVTSHVALDLLSKGNRVCIASMEMPVDSTLYRMTRQALGGDNYTQEKARFFHRSTDNRLWLFDHRGAIEWRAMMAVIRHCARVEEVDHIFIDSLVKLGVDPDDYNTQCKIVNSMCSIAYDTGIHIHLVHHCKKGTSEYDQLNKFQIKGAGEIVDQADNAVLVWANKKKQRESETEFPDAGVMREPDQILDLCNQRNGEWENRVKLWFHPKSMQFLEEQGPPMDYLERFGKLEAA